MLMWAQIIYRGTHIVCHTYIYIYSYIYIRMRIPLYIYIFGARQTDRQAGRQTDRLVS